MSDPNQAIKNEATDVKTVTVTWRDLDPFEVPMYRDDWPFEAGLAAESGERSILLVQLLPDETLRAFRTRKPKPTRRDADSLLDAIGDAMGLAGAGESSSSAG